MQGNPERRHCFGKDSESKSSVAMELMLLRFTRPSVASGLDVDVIHDVYVESMKSKRIKGKEGLTLFPQLLHRKQT